MLFITCPTFLLRAQYGYSYFWFRCGNQIRYRISCPQSLTAFMALDLCLKNTDGGSDSNKVFIDPTKSILILSK